MNKRDLIIISAVALTVGVAVYAAVIYGIVSIVKLAWS